MRFRSCGIAAVSLLALFLPAAAHAAPPLEHIHEPFTESDTFTECGLNLGFELAGKTHLMLREVPNSGGQAFLGHENVTYRVVWTNLQTGEWFVHRGHLLFKEMTARHVEGDLWEFTAQQVGQPFVIEDSDGNVVLRDRGRITYRAIFDTLGDSEPGGELLEQEITSVSGPHLGLTTDFCDLVTDMIGA